MLVIPSASTSALTAHPTYPPASLLAYWPGQNVGAISPPYRPFSLAHPFNISPELYHSMLDIAWPVTIALVYATVVSQWNRINRRRNKAAWAFSRTDTFYYLVLAHNIALAVYSAWTFNGMLGAFRRSWPGWHGPAGVAGAVDALCRFHGPRGLGSAARFTESSRSWTIDDLSMRLVGGVPDSTDVGRIWNEGLAYYGWIFYLSKFYEVLDTVVILLKGKESSALQTYHHAGAMFAMWAGIRYMSPPIWMFTFLNSGLHTLMYTYYALSAAGTRVPQPLKRTLTFLQIAQIVFGASYAFLHLFVAYDAPYYAAYEIINNVSTLLTPTSALSSASSVIASVTSSGLPTVAPGLAAWMKQAVLRAAGQEGLAENVPDVPVRATAGSRGWLGAPSKALHSYTLQSKKVHCLDTSGQVFAIVLNIVYLVPLAWLFVRFFIRYFTTERTLSTDRQGRRSIEDVKEATPNTDAAKVPVPDSSTEKEKTALPQTQTRKGKRGKTAPAVVEVNVEGGASAVVLDKST